mgnify:FL=1
MARKKIIGVYLKGDTLERLDKLTEKKNINRNKLINELLEFSIDCFEQELDIKIENDSEWRSYLSKIERESSDYWKKIEEDALEDYKELSYADM